MEIKKDCVVGMHYKLTDDQGQVLDSSDGREPLKFIQLDSAYWKPLY